MPPTISVTVGRLDPAAAAEPLGVFEPAEPAELFGLAELLQAARAAARAATLAALSRVGLGMGVLLVCRVCRDQAATASVGDGGRQDSRRCSSRPIRPSAVRAMTAMMNMAANTPSGLKLFCALAITNPRPR